MSYKKLDAIFSPKSVAVLGASTIFDKAGHDFREYSERRVYRHHVPDKPQSQIHVNTSGSIPPLLIYKEADGVMAIFLNRFARRALSLSALF